MTAVERPVLVVVAGLPGTGKTTLAATLAERLRCTHISVDTVEAALWKSGIERAHNSGVAAYEVAVAVATQQIEAGRDVVVDAVNDSQEARDMWPPVAAAHAGGRLLVLLTQLADACVHRARVENRIALPGFYTPDWPAVLERIQQYPPWRDVTALDTAASVEDVVAFAVAAVEGARNSAAPDGART